MHLGDLEMKIGFFSPLAFVAVPWKGPQIKKLMADQEMATRRK